MDLNNLKARRREVITELENVKIRHNMYTKDIEGNKATLVELDDKRNSIKTKLALLVENIETKENLIDDLKIKISLLKTQQIEDHSRALKETYLADLTAISNIRFDLNSDVFKSFALLSSFKREFKNLNLQIDKKIEIEQLNFKSFVYNQIDANIKDSKKLHNVFLFLKYIVKYDVYFKDDSFSEYFFCNISEKFRYHFMSDKETNRLDKPEWIFKFFLSEFKEYNRFFMTYKRNILGLIVMCEELINKKFIEFSAITSNQKRGLVWHFVSQYMVFMDTLSDKYQYTPKNLEFSNLMIECENEFIDTQLSDIHAKSYNLWWNEYKKLVRNSMLFFKNYQCVCEASLSPLIYLIDKIVECSNIFLDQIRFINPEEIKVLCFFYSEFNGLIEFINEEEVEMIVKLEEIEYKTFKGLVLKLLRYNKENMNLLRSLISNDVGKLLRRLRNFKYVSDKELYAFDIDIVSVLQIYTGCSDYNSLYKFVQSEVDKYLVNDILLKCRFSTEDFLRFNELFKMLLGLFEGFDWETKDAIDCIHGIFEENPQITESEIHTNIAQLYKSTY